SSGRGARARPRDSGLGLAGVVAAADVGEPRLHGVVAGHAVPEALDGRARRGVEVRDGAPAVAQQAHRGKLPVDVEPAVLRVAVVARVPDDVAFADSGAHAKAVDVVHLLVAQEVDAAADLHVPLARLRGALHDPADDAVVRRDHRVGRPVGPQEVDARVAVGHLRLGVVHRLAHGDHAGGRVVALPGRADLDALVGEV